MEDVQFGSLELRETPEKTPFTSAIVASDCYTERSSLAGRNGYRAAHASAIGSTGSQHLGRQRVSPSSVKNIAVCGGVVYTVTDPTGETAADGTVSSALGTPFGSSDKISGAQLYKNYYLGTDSASVAMQRVNSAFTLQTLQIIPQGAKPTLGSFSALSWTLFKNLSSDAPTVSGCVLQTSANTGITNIGTNWRAFTATNNGNDDPANGATALYAFASTTDASGMDWLAVVITPRTGGGIYTQGAITIQLGESNTGPWIDAGIIHDIPPVGGSPNLVFCDLRAVASTDRDALTHIRFFVSGSSGGKFGIYGYAFLPAGPLTNPQTYYVTCQDSSTLNESQPTEPLIVTIKDSDKLDQSSPVPDLKYVDSYEDSATFKSTGGNDSLLASSNQRIFNAAATGWSGKPMPTLSDIGAVVNITVTLNASWIAGQVLRLWKDTSNGRRLVLSYTLLAGDIIAGTKVLTDPGGLGVLSNVLYKPGGTGPQTNALAAFGGRLVAGYENRIYISSFVAPDVTSAVYPQWPLVALETADGWSFDFDGGGGREQVQCITAGDAIYVSTNERTLYIPNLEPRFDGGRVYYEVFNRGAVGRQCGIWAENYYIWASFDGIYMASGRNLAKELTEPIRYYYWNTFAPASTAVLHYQDRNLYCFSGTRYIRYNFTTGRWTSGTIAHTYQFASRWFDVGSSTQTGPQMWSLGSDRKIYRWQPDYTVGTTNAATTDAGTAIADWQFSTGFEVTGTNAIPKFLYADATNSFDVWVEKTATDNQNSRKIHYTQGELEYAFPADLKAHKMRLRLKGANTTIIRRLMLGREEISQKGG